MGSGHADSANPAADGNAAVEEEGDTGTTSRSTSGKQGKHQLAGKKLKLKKRMWTPYSKHEKQWLALCFIVFMYVHMFRCRT